MYVFGNQRPDVKIRLQDSETSWQLFLDLKLCVMYYLMQSNKLFLRPIATEKVGHTEDLGNKENITELVDSVSHLLNALPPLHPFTFSRFLPRVEG